MSGLERCVQVSTGRRAYPIHIGHRSQRLCKQLAELCAGRPVFVISDQNVADLHLESWLTPLASSATRPLRHLIDPGEASKSPAAWINACEAMVEHGLGRDTLLIAVGGGVVGDLGGFIAASFMRGIDFVQIPTTLLAQVDSSVGGKTAINLRHGKNLVGAFHQPLAVLIDVATLSTLPQREFRAGLAETLKYGAILDQAFFSWIESSREALTALEPAALIHAVERSCTLKAKIVAEDEREAGVRALLNFGHTFAHAIEAELNYQTLNHGEAVALGMAMAADYSVRRHGLAPDDAERLKRLIHDLSLPRVLPEGLRAINLAQRMRGDKKNRHGEIRLIGLRALGEAFIDPAGDLEVAAECFAAYGAIR